MSETKSETIICMSDGINWIWYCEVRIENGFAIVDKEYRLHKFDYSQGAGSHPKASDRYRIVEKDSERELGKSFPPRIAIGIEINWVFFPFEKECPRFEVGKS